MASGKAMPGLNAILLPKAHKEIIATFPNGNATQKFTLTEDSLITVDFYGNGWIMVFDSNGAYVSAATNTDLGHAGNFAYLKAGTYSICYGSGGYPYNSAHVVRWYD